MAVSMNSIRSSSSTMPANGTNTGLRRKFRRRFKLGK